MSEPRFAERAEADLREIWYGVASNRNERAADRVTARILDKCRAHAGFPETGRSREDIGPGLRSFPVAPYVVFFRPLGDTIGIVRVLHGRRDVGRLMRDEG